MANLVCNKRNESIKIKKLRRDGYVPGIIYGRNLDASVGVQITEKELSSNKSELTLGSQITVTVDGEAYDTLIKAIEYSPTRKTYQHFDFQVLTKGEKIKTSVSLILVNKEKIKDEGNVIEHLNAVEYEVLPKDMIDSLEIDISGLSLGHDIKLADLEIAKDDRYHLITPDNTVLVSLAPIQEVVLETEDTDEVAPEPEVEE